MRADAALVSLSLPLRLVWFAPSALQRRSCPLNLPFVAVAAGALISLELGLLSARALRERFADYTGAGREINKD